MTTVLIAPCRGFITLHIITHEPPTEVIADYMT